jgi:hypothetical protein
MTLIEQVATSSLPRGPDHDEIAKLAYSIWQLTGSSADRCWYAAINDVLAYYRAHRLNVSPSWRDA